MQNRQGRQCFLQDVAHSGERGNDAEQMVAHLRLERMEYPIDLVHDADSRRKVREHGGPDCSLGPELPRSVVDVVRVGKDREVLEKLEHE